MLPSMNVRTRTRSLVAAMIALLALSLSACGDSETEAGGGDSTATSGSTGNTTSSAGATDPAGIVKAVKWSDNVTITVSGDSVRFVSNGIPSHELPDQFLVPGGDFTPPVDASEVSPFDTAKVVTETPLDVELPLNPTYSETVTDTNLGMIGVVVSGAQLFNDYEDPNRTFVAVNDNFDIAGVDFLDACNGHPLALNVGGGNYHYHGVPYCITDDLDVAGEHSRILGYLLDGFPVYGPQDVDGTKVTGADLDECNGHNGPTPEHPNGIYHYHLKDDKSPYTPNCYHGEVTVTSAGGGGPPGGGPPPGGTP